MKHRNVMKSAGVVVFLLITLCAGAQLSEVWVDDDYSDGNAGGHTWNVDAFNNLYDAYAAVDTSGTIYMAAGSYQMSDPLVLDAKPVKILGATAGVSKKYYPVPNNYAWNTTEETFLWTNRDNRIFEGTNVAFHLDGLILTAKNRTPSLSSGDMNGIASPSYRDLIYARISGGGYSNDNLLHVQDLKIVNCVIGPNGASTTLAAGERDGKYGRFGISMGGTDGGYQNSLIANNKIFDCVGDGVNLFIIGTYHVYGTDTYDTSDYCDYSGTVIRNNEICGGARSGIELCAGIKNLVIEDNEIHTQGFINDETIKDKVKYGNGIVMSRASSDRRIPSPGYDPTGDPRDGHSPYDITVKNNKIYGCGKNGFHCGPKSQNITLLDNTVFANGYDGFLLDLKGTFWNSTFEVEPPPEYGFLDMMENITANNNKFYSNGHFNGSTTYEFGYGIRVNADPTNGFICDAENNWWGDNSGPDDSETTTPTIFGNGDEISDHVDADPWLDDQEELIAGSFLIPGQDNRDIYLPSGNGVTIHNNDSPSSASVVVDEEGWPVGRIYKGIAGDHALDMVLIVTSNLENDSFVATIKMKYTSTDMAAAGIPPGAQGWLSIHWWDEQAGQWFLAGDNNLDENLPTTVLGDYGWWEESEDHYYAWANVGHFSEFAIGQNGTVPVELSIFNLE